MRITVGRLRKLIREGLHTDTVISPTMATPRGPKNDGDDTSLYPVIHNDDTIDNKVNLVIKSVTRMGRHVSSDVVKKYLNRLDLRDVLVVPADDLAKIILKRTAN